MEKKSQISHLKSQIKLKVCGLTQLPQIQELISLNTNFLGFIFYEKSPRYVLDHLNLKQISEIKHQGKVGVFVNESVEKIIEISEKANLNLIQLHGDEDEDFIIQLKKKLSKDIEIIKVIKVSNFENLQVDLQKISNLESRISNLLFDTDSNTFGGTGKTFDWNILNHLEIPKPYFLSGGISLENIHQLSTINQQPFALDINSKFETEPGVKDVEKIKKLLKIVQVTK